MNYVIFTTVLTAYLGIGGHQPTNAQFGPEPQGPKGISYNEPTHLKSMVLNLWTPLASSRPTPTLAIYVISTATLLYLAVSLRQLTILAKAFCQAVNFYTIVYALNGFELPKLPSYVTKFLPSILGYYSMIAPPLGLSQTASGLTNFGYLTLICLTFLTTLFALCHICYHCFQCLQPREDKKQPKTNQQGLSPLPNQPPYATIQSSEKHTIFNLLSYSYILFESNPSKFITDTQKILHIANQLTRQQQDCQHLHGLVTSSWELTNSFQHLHTYCHNSETVFLSQICGQIKHGNQSPETALLPQIHGQVEHSNQKPETVFLLKFSGQVKCRNPKQETVFLSQFGGHFELRTPGQETALLPQTFGKVKRRSQYQDAHWPSSYKPVGKMSPVDKPKKTFRKPTVMRQRTSAVDTHLWFSSVTTKALPISQDMSTHPNNTMCCFQPVIISETLNQHYQVNASPREEGKATVRNIPDTYSCPTTTKRSPAVSMQAPAATKKTSISTARAPTVHMQNPVTTKLLPAVNLQAPAATKKTSAATKQMSTATARAPAATTQKPVTTKLLPAVNVQAPAATKQTSTATVQAPAATKQMSTATAQAPAATKQTSAASTQKAGKPVSKLTKLTDLNQTVN
ncbi:hypothetical protein DSO57_1014280 [Entomophthora muscae]|uniref:Uncharacterized protein n=1 Tax=Entomophthora muscae TaxID=34485 RepID=A0ACC2S7G5_9FUNG|nr:hypothetical protein DSO57_1014280 [Entomophthora muscae]